MSEIQPEPVNWLWEPYIPSGKITLIQGDGSMGKTTAAMAITAAVSTGTPLPGSGYYAEPANVIVQNAEDSYSQTIRPRLEQSGADCGMIHVIDEDEDALSFSDERIEQTIMQTKARLCILDPVQAYFKGANMNSANSVRPLMKHLGKVAERHDCAILLVGHLHKSGGKAAYRGLGSIDIYAAARSVLTVGCAGVDENIRVMVHNKSNLAPAGKPQAFTLDPVYGFTWTGEYNISVDEVERC
jgi:RecA-family ATPase